MKRKKLMDHSEIWQRHKMSRLQFLRRFGIAASALTFSPYFIDRFAMVCEAAQSLTRVYKVKNGNCFQNTAKLWEMLGGPSRYVGSNDVVVIKGNCQWKNQGYTHTGCIKGIVDGILDIPGFSGEILICDNTTAQTGLFDASTSQRLHNWPDHNWNSLAAAYQAEGKPVATKQWYNGHWRDITYPSFSAWNPADGDGFSRSFFPYQDRPTYLSYPVFESPLTPGRMIDMKNGVWENGVYTGRNVKTIFMPTLNNHGHGEWEEGYAGVTSAIKSFFGAGEIHNRKDGTFNGYYHIHSSSFTQNSALSAGELVGRFMNSMYAPSLFVTAAMWSGWESRTGKAAETKTVLACENPVSLDYISCRDVIAPYAPWLNPDNDNNTRQQLLGCNSQGIGTLNPGKIEVFAYDFDAPSATRLDVERKIRDFKQRETTEQDVKDVINLYMEGSQP